MENKDKQSALMLIDLAEKLSDLPANCRVHVLKDFIFNVELHLQQTKRFDKCLNDNDYEN